MKKIIWRKIISRGLHPVLTMEMVLRGLNYYFKKEVGLGFNIRFYKRYFGATFMEENEWQKINKKIEQKYKNLEKIINNYNKTYQKLINFARQLYQQNFSQTTDQELSNVFKKIIEKFSAVWAYCYIPWNIEEILTTKIGKILAKNKCNLSLDYCLSKLILPGYKSGGAKRRDDLIKLAKKINKISKDKFFQEIEKHQRKFFWVNTYLMNIKKYRLEEIFKEIKGMVSKNPEKLLLAAKEKEQEERLEAKRIIKLLGCPKNLVNLIKTFKKFTLWRTTKIEDLARAYCYAKPFFDEMAKRMSLTYNDFTQLKIQEILSRKFDKKEIKNRHAGYLLLMKQGKVKILSGQLLKNVLKKEWGKKERAKIIHSKSTFGGKLKGKIQILYPYQYHKIKKGYILVTPMTTPDITPHLRKIKAIITDEGGLFSHAAILAREFNIPTVLGTKIATKVLRDNDLVEIDGKNGVVKILSK